MVEYKILRIRTKPTILVTFKDTKESPANKTNLNPQQNL